jgi:hypothetical protein
MYQRFDSDRMDDWFYENDGFLDEFDENDQDFDAAASRARQQQIRAEQQRRRRLAKQQRRSQRQSRRLPQPPRPVPSPITPTRPLTLLERVQLGAGRILDRISHPTFKPIAGAVGNVLGLVPHPVAQTASTVISAGLDSLPADAFDELEDMLDWAEMADQLDEAAPAIANLTVRSTMPGSIYLPRPLRRQLVNSVAEATQMLAAHQGAQAARSIPLIVSSVQRSARQHRLPVRELPQAIYRTTAAVANSPRLVHGLAQATMRR